MRVFAILLSLTLGPQVLAHDLACMGRLVSLRQSAAWLRALNVKDSEYDSSPEYESLLLQTQSKLKSFGIDSRRRRRRQEDKVRQLIEVTSIAPINVNGRLIRRARERFGVRVYIDPVMMRLGEGKGATDAPIEPTVYLDYMEVQRHFETPNLVLLHEIRHIYFSSEAANGREHKYQGDMIANDGFRFERQGFYDDEVSFEELSNYALDARINQRRYARGEVARGKWLQDLKNLLRISKLIGRHLRMVRADTPNHLLFTDSGEGHDGRVLVWPVVRTRFAEDDILFWVHLDFPGERLGASVRRLREAAWIRIGALIAEADRMREFAETNLAGLQP